MSPPSPLASRLLGLLGKASLALVVLFLAALGIYAGLVAWLHHSVAGQAVSITQAAGFPAETERSFRGLLSWLLAFAAMPVLVRLVLESLRPSRSTGRILGRLTLLLVFALGISLLPHSLRLLRGVDQAGLPVAMRPSDPAKAVWWVPDGTPVLFHSREDDGGLRFWNRPGMTPDSGVPSLPVTREVRKEWQRSLEAEAALRRAQEEAARKAAEEARLREENTRREQAARREEQERQARAAAEAKLRRDLTLAEARVEEARRLSEVARAGTAAENARAAKLQEEKEKLRAELQAERERERKRVVAQTAAERQAANDPPWQTAHLRPGIFFTAKGRPGARIEIRSNGQGACHLPDGRKPVPFGSGSFSFRNPHAECRFLCRQNSPLQVSYRWTAP